MNPGCMSNEIFLWKPDENLPIAAKISQSGTKESLNYVYFNFNRFFFT